MTNSITMRLADCTKPIEDTVKRIIDKYDDGSINDYIYNINNKTTTNDNDDNNNDDDNNNGNDNTINVDLNIGGSPYTINVNTNTNNDNNCLSAATKFCIENKDTFNIVDSQLESHCIQPIRMQLDHAIIEYKKKH